MTDASRKGRVRTHSKTGVSAKRGRIAKRTWARTTEIKSNGVASGTSLNLPPHSESILRARQLAPCFMEG